MYYSLTKSEIDKPISFGTALENFKEYVKKNNSSSNSKIKLGLRVLAEQIIKQSIRTLTYQKPYNYEQGYYLSTKISSLATLCNVTGRTISNQLKVLEKIGVLKYNREQYGIKIFINPKTISHRSVRKNFHPLDKELTCSKEYNTISRVDKLITSKDHSAELISKNNKKGDTVGCQDLNKSRQPAAPFKFHCQTITFFNKAIKDLYPDIILSDTREFNLKVIIQNQVLNEGDGFNDPFKVLDFNLYALKKAKKWFDKRPNFTLPDPEYYFKNHSREAFTFSKTKEWVKISLIEKAQKDYLNGIKTSGELSRLIVKIIGETQLSNSSKKIFRNAF